MGEKDPINLSSESTYQFAAYKCKIQLYNTIFINSFSF